MVIVIDAANLKATLKTLVDAGSELVELVTARVGRGAKAETKLTLRGGRRDKNTGLADSGFLLETGTGLELRHGFKGNAMVMSRPLLAALTACTGRVVIGTREGRLVLRGKTESGSVLELSWPQTGLTLPVMPKPEDGAPTVAVDSQALTEALALVTPAVAKAKAANDATADVVVELEHAAVGSDEGSLRLSAFDGFMLLQRGLCAIATDIPLSKPQRLPLEAVQALSLLGVGQVTLSWANQLAVRGVEGAVLIPLRAAAAPSLMNLMVKAKPDDSRGKVLLKKAELAEAVAALAASGTDTKAVHIATEGKILRLTLAASDVAQGSIAVSADTKKAFGAVLGLDMLQIASKVAGDEVCLQLGGAQSHMVSLAKGAEILGLLAQQLYVAPEALPKAA